MGIKNEQSTRFGKSAEYSIIGKMLLEGLDVYVPLVDDHGVDCVIKKGNGEFVEVQIKARSKNVKKNDAAFFACIKHKPTPNYYFVFYSELLDAMWIMSSEEFLNECVTNKSGNNSGKHSISFNGNRKDKKTGKDIPCCKDRFDKYRCKDFSMFY